MAGAEVPAPSIPPQRQSFIVRIKLPPPWTPDEDSRLRRLAWENGFRHWTRVASEMPGRTSGECRYRWRDHLARDVYHRPFTGCDDDELARLFFRHAGNWKDISRAIHGRSTRSLKRRWRVVRESDAFLRKLRRPLPPPLPVADQEDDGMDAEPSSSAQHPYDDLLASAVASCSLGTNTGGSAADASTSIALGFSCMAI